jgi:hypothetical protein
MSAVVVSRPGGPDRSRGAIRERTERDAAALRCTAVRAIGEPLFAAVPVVGRRMIPSPDAGPEVPVLTVSPRRPDVADLGRVLEAEGSGMAASVWRWVPGHGLTADRMVLDVTVTAPVRTSFVVAFTLPRDRWLLDGIVRSGRLGLVSGGAGAGPIALLRPSTDDLAGILSRLDGEV